MLYVKRREKMCLVEETTIIEKVHRLNDMSKNSDHSERLLVISLTHNPLTLCIDSFIGNLLLRPCNI